MEHALAKPRWRGRLHQVAFFVSLPLGGILIATAQSAAARVAGAVYAISLSGLYGASALFHRITWRPRAWTWMRRLDHSMIFVLIAGSYTPYALLVLRPPWSTIILAVVWTGALIGIGFRVFSERLSAFVQALYMVLGWIAVFTLPLTISRMGVGGVLLLMTGGLFYTIGAILFGMRRPDPNPAVFGYHEFWHSMVIGGTICHYALNLMLVLRG